VITTIENDKLRVAIKSKGAEITSIKTAADGREFIWEGDPDVWSGQSPLLFPIIGGLKDDVYRLNGKEYKLPKHGFGRTSEYDLVESSADKLVYELRQSAETTWRASACILLTVRGANGSVTW
jgi:galactose mutarotase-like enzyme